MNDEELDRALNGWKAPAASRELRTRVLAAFPRRQWLSFGRPLQWAAALAMLVCMLGLGMEQASHGSLDSFAAGVRKTTEDVEAWFDRMWIAHIVMAFGNSDLKVYVDGEARTDVVVGGSHGALWVQLPGEGRYYLRLNGFRGPGVPGRFDGHALEFQAGGRAVKVESRKTYGFGGQRQVFLMGPVRAGQ
jgi:hypothetical protein